MRKTSRRENDCWELRAMMEKLLVEIAELRVMEGRDRMFKAFKVFNGAAFRMGFLDVIEDNSVTDEANADWKEVDTSIQAVAEKINTDSYLGTLMASFRLEGNEYLSKIEKVTEAFIEWLDDEVEE